MIVLTLEHPHTQAGLARTSDAEFLPRVGRQRSRIWRTQRNRGAAHFPALAMCPEEAWPIFAYLEIGLNLITIFEEVIIKIKLFNTRRTHCEYLQINFNLLGMRLMALSGLSTRIVLIAVRFRFSTCRQYSSAPASTIKKSRRFQESARYVFFP